MVNALVHEESQQTSIPGRLLIFLRIICNDILMQHGEQGLIHRDIYGHCVFTGG